VQSLLAATRRVLETIRPLGGSAAPGGRLGDRDLVLIGATGLLVLVSAPALFVRCVTAIDPAWPDASPVMLYVIEVGRALGAG
jgi:hypothetical protein